MNTKSPHSITARSRSFLALRMWCVLLTLLGATALKVQAASQIWTNAPIDGQWSNVLNWVSKAVPGDVNNFTANTVNGDIATFNAPIVGGIGSVANPVVPDDATVNNGRSRRVAGIIFDTTNCGAYYIASPSPAVPPAGVPATGILYVSHNLGTNAAGYTNGAIRITDSVPNSQVVAVPILVNLPSSTGGIFYMVNNSTNPGVTLTLNSLTHDGAATRGTIFILEGTNILDNVVTNLSEGPSTAAAGNAGGITKAGPGRWIIAGPGTFIGNSVINVQQGTLVVRDPSAFGVTLTTPINVTNSVLQIDGVTLNQNAITLQSGGVVRVSGTATVNGITVPNVIGTSATLTTSNATDVVTVGNGPNKVTGGNATSLVHLTGPGTILLDQANNYIGKYSLDTGTNQVSDVGALGLAANYNLNAGAVLDLTPLGAIPYLFTPRSLNANGTGAVAAAASMITADPGATVDMQSRAINLNFTPTAFLGDSGHAALFLARGSFAFHGNAITVNNASGTPLGIGTYQIVHQATGPISSSGAFIAVVTGGGLAAGTVPEIVASGSDLNLIVTAYVPKPLVWTGNDPLLPGVWDRLGSTNWLNGITPVTFNIYDTVTFDATGSAQPSVNLASIMQPGFVTVDNSAGDYTFTTTATTPPGQIAGGAGLFKKGAGTLFVNTANTYSGGTITTNGTIKLGIDNALPSTGAGDVTNISPAVIDLNGFADTIGALDGNGTVDITGNGTSTLTFGANDNNGTFTGLIENSAGTLNITKTGLGTETITKSNSYAGTTDIEQGTLKFTDPNGMGNGTSPLVINGGTLDLATNLNVSTLSGAGGTIANLSNTATNTLTFLGPGAGTLSFAGSINTGAGKVALRVMSGILRLTGASTYTNGTFVAGGATFQIHNSPAAAPSFLIASNGATVGLSGGSSTPVTPISVTTVDGGTVTFASGAEGEIWTGQFLGTAATTNIFTTPQSAGGNTSFSNFLGLVKINLATSSQNFRFFNGGGLSGGDNTTFEFDSGNVHTRDAQVVTLGNVVGGSTISGIGGPATAGAVTTYIIGNKNLDMAFEGYITGANTIVKSGTGRLTLDAFPTSTNTDGLTFTNYVYASALGYLNNTVVSNGVLAISLPNDLTTSANLILAATNAVLDCTAMGYVSNYTDAFSNPGSVLVTNGTLTIVASTGIGLVPQVLSGIGIVKSTGITNYGTINPGLAGAGGTLIISNAPLVVNAGATNFFDLSDDPAGTVRPSDKLVVQGSVTLSGSSVIGLSALNGQIQPGTYTLIKYSSLINESGAVPPGPVSNLSLGGPLPATSRATMALNNTGTELDLVVVSLNTTNLTWTGDGVSNLWDVVNSFTFTNFVNPMQFYQQDNVTFDNTSSPTNDSVFISGAVAPTSITVNTATTNFIFGGNGLIQGAAVLIKTGTGTLILTNNGVNTYTGGTIISNGVLNVGMDSGNNQNDRAMGNGAVAIKAGAELRFGGNAGGVVNHLITNAIVIEGGILRVEDGFQHLTNSSVTVSALGATLVTVFPTKNLALESPLLGTGPVTMAAIQAGTNQTGGQIILSHGSNTLSGSVTVLTNQNLALVGNAGLSNSPTLDIQQGAILDFTARSNTAWSVTSGQTLKGNGTIRGRFVTTLAGSTIAPGIAGAIGTLTFANNLATTNTVLTLAGATSIDINRGANPNTDRIVNTTGTNAMGGTLTVNNLGVALVAGDSFQFMLSATNTGAFTVTNLPALNSGLAWSNSLSLNGRITVIASVLIPTIPPAITNFSLAGGNVVISGTNGQSGGTYYLLMTTNLAKPFPQWRTVATNVLTGSNFTFIGTNTVLSALGQQFYSLSSTNFNP